MTSGDDLRDLFDHVRERLRDRLCGLTDDEWDWRPTPGDPDIGIRWRLDHIAATLRDSRNREWLGVTTDSTPTATAARLADPIGPAAGRFAQASWLSFAHHIADELIHHGAEVGLLRDLYAHLARR